MVLENLDPKLVWGIFEHIFLATPHESKHEEKIRAKIKDWVKKTAQKHDPSITLAQDAVGNLFICKPATKGMEDAPALLMQGHMDMVCVSNDPFDFENRPITPKIQDNGEWLEADGTSLGADNGIGVSLALATLIDADSSFSHGPLEVLITVDEETGLTGAFELDIEKIPIKSRLMLNLDSEELGNITIGSAGGGDSKMEKELSKSSDYSTFSKFYQLSVFGLMGGHSGGDIHLPRANANKIIARMMSKILIAGWIPVISQWNGGSKHNAITRKSELIFGVKMDEDSKVIGMLEKEKSAILSYFKHPDNTFEANMEISLKEVEPNPYFASGESAHIIHTGNLIPSQAITASPTIPGLTETSNNLAIVETTSTGIDLLLSSRSSVQADLEWVRDQLAQIALLNGWKFTREKAYPGWNPEPENSFTKFVKRVYEGEMDAEVELGAVHGGLETGVIGALIPGISMVAIGPNIENPHSPDERVQIASVAQMYGILKQILSKIKEFTP
ncbi:MAG: beta-Ala-His dipeptidase [Promethearchaeota archaeon]